ncbi:hypothetical protein D2V04_06150 [Pelagerythrobacter aerophilus]|uniref:Uncharacterized protein n=2 Tax=Pelagerythrobacter aerophilus TaxID=2306995 RepID=A0A418NJS7_9SPHN|nr:hypothetical protein D2V04_06150 [Pelagerythrobacter aerophilus]
MLLEVAVPDNLVVRKNQHLSNARAKELAASGVRKAVKAHGKDKVANAADVQVRTVEKWMAEASLPSIDNLLNIANLHRGVSDALHQEMGWAGLTPSRANPANDLELAAGLGHSVAELIDRLRDGKRCHVDTAVLAALFRELIPQMQAVVDEDDARRAA